MRTWDSGEGNESVGLGALLPVWLRLALSSIKENREQPDTTAGAGGTGALRCSSAQRLAGHRSSALGKRAQFCLNRLETQKMTPCT